MENKLIYIAAGLLLGAVVFACIKAFKRDSGEDIDKMSGVEFEDFCAELLHRNGIEVLELTKASGDFGADIIVIHDGERTAVQCKRYSGSIGVKAVQEAVSAKAYYKCQKAAVITNSTFTRQARELAAEDKVILWDREDVFAFENAVMGGGARNAYATLKIYCIKQEKGGENPLILTVNGVEYEISPHNGAVLNVPAGRAVIALKIGRRKAVIKPDLKEETRLLAVGEYKNKPFLSEMC